MKKSIIFFCIFIYTFSYSQSTYEINVNKVRLWLKNDGEIGSVCSQGCGGRYEESKFLYSGGFWISGYDADSLWASGMATSGFIFNYIPGNVDSNQYDPRYDMYTVDPYSDFGTDWQRYRFAVSVGADFYDGNGDGIYDPVDLNGNGSWDPDEDKPDILGNKTVWCVFNDGYLPRSRPYGSYPKGIEMHQTVFGYTNYTGGQLENVVFIRYKILNKGTVNNVLDSVYFSLWADPDLGGNYNDDLDGCDTLLSSGYLYNNGPDTVEISDTPYGDNPPAFFLTLLQGPQSYIPGVTFIDQNSNGEYDEGIDTPLDTAYNRRGPDLGVEIFPGAANMGMTSFMQITRHHIENNDPDSVIHTRYYSLGLSRQGVPIDPCTYIFGTVLGGIDCNDVNPGYMFSGDPVTETGWINNFQEDQRLIVNTGPFKLEMNKPVTIIAAYIVGRGADYLNSITKAREIAEITHFFYENNFNTNVLVVKDETESNTADDYQLMQNYPNPFNPVTTIKYRIPETVKVKLAVYDLLGREVQVLVNEEKSAGSYSLNFDATLLPSGVYFYRLITDNYIETKKMILMR